MIRNCWIFQLRTVLLAAAAIGSAIVPSRGQDGHSGNEYQQTVLPFLKQHCLACHGNREAAAGLRLDELGTDFLAGKTADLWKEVIDRINLDEMPPEDQPRPDPREAFTVVEWVGRELKEAEKAARMAGGRILSRRMNRDEYVNTLRDLLHLDENFVQTLKDDLPGDGKAEGFDRLGAALLFDATQLSTYIELGGRVAEKAIVEGGRPPAAGKLHVDMAKTWRPGRQTHQVIQYQPDTEIAAGPEVSEPTDHGVIFLQPVVFGGKPEFGGLGSRFNVALNQIPVTEDGYYRIRIKAGAFHGDRDHPVKMRYTYLPNTPLQTQEEFEVSGSLEQPEVIEIQAFLRQPPEGGKANLRLDWNGLLDVVVPHPELNALSIRRIRATSQVQRLIAAEAPREEIEAAKAEVERRIAEVRAYARRPDAVWKIYNPEHNLERIPRLLVEWVEIEGPIEKQWPPASHAALFPDGLRTDRQGLRAMFARLLPRAYRRAVSDSEIERMITAVEHARSTFEMDDLAAVRYGLQTVLSSPDFLLLFEPSEADAGVRRITGHELATRLSYFLWSTMPDDELTALAESGALHKPDVLRQQVARMLADRKARQFAENFAGQWLHVRDYASVMPARDYSDYDPALRDAGAEEPIAFFEQIVRENFSILNFLESDFTMANERLARFYGIDGVEGPEFRRVPLTPEQHRGGVLTMAGVLTYLSDGTRTLPVRRGAWILEEIFNSPPPPPPPGAGEVQPNVRGERLTVRERLEQHRQNASCASCHAKIDPLGLALENYDAIGAWRTRQNGEDFRGNNTPPIDASGTLPGGRSFAGPAEFKQALLEDKDRFVRAFTQKMLTYALCRPVGYTDRATVEAIVADVERNDYRMHTLIRGIVTCDAFQSK